MVIKNTPFQRVYEFLSLLLNPNMAITNNPKLIINDKVSNVSILTPPPYIQLARIYVCPIQRYRQHFWGFYHYSHLSIIVILKQQDLYLSGFSSRFQIPHRQGYLQIVPFLFRIEQ